ncbi:hypothetical protein [Streptomyces sp. NPDC050145]|uniref:hypothetical protein n=1 Tax=Streptomyces sp. NPDC050145 TaxID=3365602 RepID=UPI0037A00E0C
MSQLAHKVLMTRREQLKLVTVGGRRRRRSVALLMDQLVTGLRRPARGAAFTAAFMCAAFLVGCTQGTDAEKPADGADRSASKSPAPASGDDEALGKKVRAALGTESIDDSDPLFVESGLERVRDGIHSRSELDAGKTYQLSIACSGKGRVRVNVSLGGALEDTTPCDGVPLLRTIERAPGTLRIDVDAVSGAGGMVGWSITRVAD